MRAIERRKDEIGIPASIQTSFQGTAAAFLASLANEPILILAAVITVYIVLGVLYESYIHPITILSTLPSAGVGAILALLICTTEFSVIALIGLILLIGIVKKNAIMMIDFALEAERKEGKSPLEAIYEACLLRFRPIMMTTMAALLGGLPLALGTGTGSELRRPLGITIVGGLLVSQLLTLYTTPVVYLAFDWLSRRLRQRFHMAMPAEEPRGRLSREHLLQHFGPIHPPPRCDVAADYRDSARRGHRFPFAAGSAASAGRFPTISVSAGLPGASPETWLPLWRRLSNASSAASLASRR